MVLLCCSYDKSERANSEIVYVCSGASAKRYHKSENCRGLLNCGGIIEEMSVSELRAKVKHNVGFAIKYSWSRKDVVFRDGESFRLLLSDERLIRLSRF